MKNVLVALLISAGAVACADNRPARTPTTTSATTTSSVTEESTATSAQNALTAPSTSSDTTTTSAPLGPTNAGVDPALAPPPLPPSQPDTNINSADATNTKLNERDRSGSTLTPMNQGGGNDLKISAAIRRSVVSDSSVSFTGKNVKIITKDGRVTLRGPVKTEAEKALIDGKARNAPGVVDVDDQLEVNTSK